MARVQCAQVCTAPYVALWREELHGRRRASARSFIPNSDGKRQRLYHGTRVDLKLGDLIAPGYASNYGKQKKATYVYLTGTLDAAIWGGELARGEGPEESPSSSRPAGLSMTPI